MFLMHMQFSTATWNAKELLVITEVGKKEL